jgi:hypothetical protein
MDGAFEQGNHFFLKPKGSGQVKIEWVEIEEYKKFVDLTRFPLAKMYGEHLLEETPAGLKITTTMKVKGVLSFLWIKLVAQGIVDALPQEMPLQVQAARLL